VNIIWPSWNHIDMSDIVPTLINKLLLWWSEKWGKTNNSSHTLDFLKLWKLNDMLLFTVKLFKTFYSNKYSEWTLITMHKEIQIQDWEQDLVS